MMHSLRSLAPPGNLENEFGWKGSLVGVFVIHTKDTDLSVKVDAKVVLEKMFGQAPTLGKGGCVGLAIKRSGNGDKRFAVRAMQ